MLWPEPLKFFFCLFNGDPLEKHRQNSVKMWDPDSLPNEVPKNRLPVSPDRFYQLLPAPSSLSLASQLWFTSEPLFVLLPIWGANPLLI